MTKRVPGGDGPPADRAADAATVSDVAEVAAIILCGGTARRFGGQDKTAAPLGQSTVLDHLLCALPAHWLLVCVGLPRPVARAVTWTRENPPLGGPVAGIAAGLGALAGPEGMGALAGPEGLGLDAVVVLAGDQPFAGEAAVEVSRRLLAADPEVDAVAARHGEDRPQLLLAAYRPAPLLAAVGESAHDCGVYATLSGLRIALAPVADHATLDIDAPHDLTAAHRLHDRTPPA